MPYQLRKVQFLAKSELSTSYKIRKMKLILKIHINKNGNITLSQYTYSEQILKHFYITKYKPASILLPLRVMLTNNDSLSLLDKTKEIKDIPYHEVLGLLIWLQVTTYSDLSFSINLLSHFTYNPSKIY